MYHFLTIVMLKNHKSYKLEIVYAFFIAYIYKKNCFNIANIIIEHQNYLSFKEASS